jgi:hypothetical protein
MVSVYDADPSQAKIRVGGAPELGTVIASTLKLKPKTLVLLVRNTGINDPQALGKQITGAGVRLVLIVLDNPTEEQRQSQQQFVKAAGADATFLSYENLQELQQHFDERKLPG